MDNFLTTTLSKPFESRPHVLQQWDWFFIISLLFLSLLAIIRLRFYKSFSLSYRELIKGSSGSRAYNNDVLPTRFPFSLLVVSTCIVFSLAFYVLFYQSFKQENILLFLWIFLMVMAFLILRFFLLKWVGLLFNIKNSISEWLELTVMLSFISAVLCFPFVFIAYYYSFLSLLVVSLIIFIVVFLIEFAGGWTIFKKSLRIYEYFLYLCTIEILPLLIFLKFITNRLTVL